MLQMARHPFRVPPWRYREDVVKPCSCPIWGQSGALTPPVTPAIRGRPAASWLIIINALGLFLRAVPHPCRCPPCVPPHSPPVPSCSPPRLLPPTAAFSSLPTRPMVTASMNASPGAKNAALTPPAPTASHGNLHRPPPIDASIPTKSPARFRKTAAIDAPATVAANTSPSPASASAVSAPVESEPGFAHGSNPGQALARKRHGGDYRGISRAGCHIRAPETT